jgi:hypothetical protein
MEGGNVFAVQEGGFDNVFAYLVFAHGRWKLRMVYMINESMSCTLPTQYGMECLFDKFDITSSHGLFFVAVNLLEMHSQSQTSVTNHTPHQLDASISRHAYRLPFMLYAATLPNAVSNLVALEQPRGFVLWVRKDEGYPHQRVRLGKSNQESASPSPTNIISIERSKAKALHHPHPITQVIPQYPHQNHACSYNPRRPPLRPRPAPKQPQTRATALHPRHRILRHRNPQPAKFFLHTRHPGLRRRSRRLRRANMRP